MSLRPMTADDIIGMVAASKSRQVGEYVQPLVDHESGRGRHTVRIVEVVKTAERFGPQVTYEGVDADGDRYRFYPSDDPRPGFEEEFWSDCAKEPA